jgi:hypothetical protein
MTDPLTTADALWRKLVEHQPAVAAALAVQLRGLPEDWPLRELGVSRPDTALELPTATMPMEVEPHAADHGENCPPCGEDGTHCRFHAGFIAGYETLNQPLREAVRIDPSVTVATVLGRLADAEEATESGELAAAVEVTTRKDGTAMPNIRIKRERKPGWRKPPGCMIVDRTSDFGNPFTIAQFLDIGYPEPQARSMAISEFRSWLRGSRDTWTTDEADQRREKLLGRLPELRGMNLACPCEEGTPCHGDVLLEWAALEWTALEVRIASARARVDRQRIAQMYDADALADVLTQDVGLWCLVDVDLGDGIPQRWDSSTWSQYLASQRRAEEPVTARLVEVYA